MSGHLKSPLGWTLAPPGETVPPATGRDVRRLLLGGVVLLVLVNLAAAALLEFKNPNRGTWLITHKAALARTGPAVETLLLGDSTCNQGLRPDAVGAALGGGALNLCAIGTLGVVGDVILLDRYLAHHPAPKRVIVSHAPDVWHRAPGASQLGLLSPVEADAAMLSAAGVGGGVARGKMLAARWLPLHGATRSLQDFVRHPVETWHRDFGVDELGFMEVRASDAALQAEDIEKMRLTLAALEGPLPPSNVAALRALAARAEAVGFAIYLLPSAVAAPVAEAPGFDAFTEQLVHAAQAALGESRRARWLARMFRPFPLSQMEQADHLLADGAEVFTAEVVALVRAAEAR